MRLYGPAAFNAANSAPSGVLQVVAATRFYESRRLEAIVHASTLTGQTSWPCTRTTASTWTVRAPASRFETCGLGTQSGTYA